MEFDEFVWCCPLYQTSWGDFLSITNNQIPIKIFPHCMPAKVLSWRESAKILGLHIHRKSFFLPELIRAKLYDSCRSFPFADYTQLIKHINSIKYPLPSNIFVENIMTVQCVVKIPYSYTIEMGDKYWMWGDVCSLPPLYLPTMCSCSSGPNGLVEQSVTTLLFEFVCPHQKLFTIPCAVH